jgi:hypothetical protein
MVFSGSPAWTAKTCSTTSAWLCLTAEVLLIFEFEMARFENSAAVRNVSAYSAFEDPVKATQDLLRDVKGAAGGIGLELRTRSLSVEYFEQLQGTGGQHGVPPAHLAPQVRPACRH